ncbi:MAG: alpha/beta hydrolase [Chloroflexota bacterium]|nr:alpha/beta hydrolase [Chloroflexota bacterium]
MPDLPNVYLAHGASGSAASMKPHVDGLLARGVPARAVQLPRGTVERAIPVYATAIGDDPSPVIGGHSFGGRVGSLLAAERGVRGVVLLSYPLHRPGGPETWDARTVHWSRIACPVLLLSGESDPFARLPLLRQAVGRLARAELVTYSGVGHGIGRVLDDALDRISGFVRSLA